MRTLITILLISCVISTHAQEVNHIGSSEKAIYTAFMSIGLCAMYDAALDVKNYQLMSVTTIYMAGVAYELCVNQQSDFTIVYGFIGCLVGVGVYMLVDHLLERKHKKKILLAY